MKVDKKFIKKIIILIFILEIFIPDLFASVQIYPTRIETKANPGEVITNYFMFENKNKEEINVTMFFKDWYKLKENKDISASEYLKVEPKEFTVLPSEKKIIRCIAKVPQKAVGELVSMIYFCYKERKETILNTRFGVSLYIAIEGTIKKQGKINNFKVMKHKNNKDINYIFSIEIENTGNVHLRPSGIIKIRNKYDKPVKTVEIKYGWPVYPGQKYKYTGVWTVKEELNGKFKAEFVIKDLKEDGVVTQEFEFEL